MHVGLVVMVVRGNDPVPVLEGLMALLSEFFFSLILASLFA